MNYIGIRGHRGSGKNFFSYLLGRTLNYYIEGKSEEKLYDVFKEWYDDIIYHDGDYSEIDYDMNYIYLDSFGDTPKTLVELLLGCEHKYIYNDYYKDHIIINLKDFSYNLHENLDDIKVINPSELFLLMNRDIQPITEDIYITMRDFIVYFGKEVMQRFFGVNVWVKSLIQSNNRFQYIDDENSYKIYTDVKSNSEIAYVKNNNGVIIKIERPSNKKSSKGIDTTDDVYDYLVTINNTPEKLFEDIKNITKDILKI